MEEHAISAGIDRPGRKLVLECGSRRYPVVAIGPDSCLIETDGTAVPRGLADVFDGEVHVAECLIVPAAPEGPFLRCGFKRWTPSRVDPPRDFAN